MKKKFLKLYPNCKLVQGKEKAAIYDLQLEQIFFVPNTMNDFVNLTEKCEVANYINQVNSRRLLNQYLEYLFARNLAFYTDEPERFPTLSIDYFSPEHIKNAVIEYEFDNYNIEQLFKELDGLLCRHIELRLIAENQTSNNLLRICRAFENTTLRSANLYINYSERMGQEILTEVYDHFKKISLITVYNSPEEKHLKENLSIKYIKNCEEEIFGKHFPRNIYTINIQYFTEAHHFNPYYNKKVCIDRKGNIKNCLLHKSGFGSYSKTNTLHDIIREEKFTWLWNIKHDMIEEVKDMETRYGIMLSNDIEERNGKYYLKDD
jgi:SPASM domain peptide maturase of grasp-with-spasm system